MRVGFTATEHGLTGRQCDRLVALGMDKRISSIDHGDCIGGDRQIHDLVWNLRDDVKIWIWPPENEKKRAWCAVDNDEQRTSDRVFVFPRQPYLKRDRDIVDVSDCLVAFPREMRETPRGGVWYTVRYARKKFRQVVIIYPDGSKEGGLIG